MRSVPHCVHQCDAVHAGAAQAKVDITIDKDNQQMTVAVDGVAGYSEMRPQKRLASDWKCLRACP